LTLPDVNVLVYVHREDATGHDSFFEWWRSVAASGEAFGIAAAVLAGFLQVATHPRVFNPPTPLSTAIEFAQQVRSLPNCVEIQPGPRHWDIFVGLCQAAGAKGNLIPDAYLAALAIESGSEWVTTDRDYARFPGLRWRHPLE